MKVIGFTDNYLGSTQNQYIYIHIDLQLKYKCNREKLYIANCLRKIIPPIQNFSVFRSIPRSVFIKNVELCDVLIYIYLFYLFVAAPSGETSS